MWKYCLIIGVTAALVLLNAGEIWLGIRPLGGAWNNWAWLPFLVIIIICLATPTYAGYSRAEEDRDNRFLAWFFFLLATITRGAYGVVPLNDRVMMIIESLLSSYAFYLAVVAYQQRWPRRRNTKPCAG